MGDTPARTAPGCRGGARAAQRSGMGWSAVGERVPGVSGLPGHLERVLRGLHPSCARASPSPTRRRVPRSDEPPCLVLGCPEVSRTPRLTVGIECPRVVHGPAWVPKTAFGETSCPRSRPHVGVCLGLVLVPAGGSRCGRFSVRPVLGAAGFRCLRSRCCRFSVPPFSVLPSPPGRPLLLCPQRPCPRRPSAPGTRDLAHPAS